MPSVCFYFQVHQPHRLRKYHVFEIGNGNNYFDDVKNEAICKKVAQKCYLPANKLIHDLIHETDGNFRVSYSITGLVLEQFEQYCPEVVESFIDLVDTGVVELLDETYYHSISFLYSEEEFRTHLTEMKQYIPPNVPLFFISHQPPIDSPCDQVRNGMHVGSVSIHDFIIENQPLLCLTGHIHESVCMDFMDKTIIVNPGPLDIGGYVQIEFSERIYNINLMRGKKVLRRL